MTSKQWRGCLSPRLEERYHDMLREIATREGKTQTEMLRELIKEKHKEGANE